jgi:hypothetical protein
LLRHTPFATYSLHWRPHNIVKHQNALDRGSVSADCKVVVGLSRLNPTVVFAQPEKTQKKDPSRGGLQNTVVLVRPAAQQNPTLPPPGPRVWVVRPGFIWTRGHLRLQRVAGCRLWVDDGFSLGLFWLWGRPQATGDTVWEDRESGRRKGECLGRWWRVSEWVGSVTRPKSRELLSFVCSCLNLRLESEIDVNQAMASMVHVPSTSKIRHQVLHAEHLRTEAIPNFSVATWGCTF